MVFIENENEDKQKLERDIVFDYCKAHPNSALARIDEEIGVDVAVRMMDLFQGTVISFPSRNALRRSVIPMMIQRYLFAVKVDSDVFKERVKQLSKTYKLSKRAIIEMNKTGKYTR